MKKFDYIRSKRRSSPGSFFRRLFRVGSIKKPFSGHFFFVFFAPLAKESESVQEIQQQSKEIKEREREMKRKLLV